MICVGLQKSTLTPEPQFGQDIASQTSSSQSVPHKTLHSKQIHQTGYPSRDSMQCSPHPGGVCEPMNVGGTDEAQMDARRGPGGPQGGEEPTWPTVPGGGRVAPPFPGGLPGGSPADHPDEVMVDIFSLRIGPPA